MIFFADKSIQESGAGSMLLELVNAAIREVQPAKLFSESVSLRGDLLTVQGRQFNIVGRRIFVIGAGKLAASMAAEAEKILGADRIAAGLVITHQALAKLQKVKICTADHPIPSERGLLGAKEMYALKEQHKISERDIVIVLVSGGGSALMPHPVDGISLEDKKTLYNLFINRGVPGFESTKIKANISRVKGGQVARHFFPAEIISLIISDDNGKSGDVNTASGPCTNHEATVQDALAVIEKYHLRQDVPRSIVAYLEQRVGVPKERIDWGRVHQFVLGSNKTLLRAMEKEAKVKGLRVIVRLEVDGEAQDAAKAFCRTLLPDASQKQTLHLWGGETTVSLPAEHGKGGRNQEFMATCLKCLPSGAQDWALASVATDGVDFLPESAGGIITADTIRCAAAENIDVDSYLKKHDSYNLLRLLSAHIATNKPTQTNVGDIMAHVQL